MILIIGQLMIISHITLRNVGKTMKIVATMVIKGVTKTLEIGASEKYLERALKQIKKWVLKNELHVGATISLALFAKGGKEIGESGLVEFDEYDNAWTFCMNALLRAIRNMNGDFL